MTIEQKEFISRMKLLMEYNIKKTYSENASKFLLKEQNTDGEGYLQLIDTITTGNVEDSKESNEVKVAVGQYNIVQYFFKNITGEKLYIYNIEPPKVSNFSYNLMSVVNYATNQQFNLPFTIDRDGVFVVYVLVMDEKGINEGDADKIIADLTEQGLYNVNLQDNVQDFLKDNNTNNEIVIYTNKQSDERKVARQVGFTLGASYTDLSLEYSKSLELASQRKSVPTELPNGVKSPGGYDVPEGFSPFVYDLFLYELWKFFGTGPKEFGMESIGGESPCIKYWNDLVPDDVKDSIEGKSSSFLNRALEDIKDIFRFTPDECEEGVQKILDFYYNEKFPQGTIPELKNRFQGEYDDINKKIQEFENSHMSSSDTGKKTDTGPRFNYEKLSDEEKKEYDKLIEQKLSIEGNYGYDARSGFDKFMDSPWGIGFQLLAMVVLATLGSSFGGEVAAGEIGWGLIAELMFNTSMALYYGSRGMTFDAFLWFCFSFLGKLHNVYEMIWAGMANSSKVLISGGKSSIPTIAGSIANKLASSGAKISSWQDYIAFRQLLNIEEKIVLDNLMRQDVNTIVNSIKALGESNFNTMRGAYKQIPKLKIEKMGPAVTRGSIKVLSDLYLISFLREEYDSLITYLKNSGFNIDFGQGEKRQSTLKALEVQGITEADLTNLQNNIKSLESVIGEVDAKLYKYYLSKILSRIESSAEEDWKKFDSSTDLELVPSPETNDGIKDLKNEMFKLESQRDSIQKEVEEARRLASGDKEVTLLDTNQVLLDRFNQFMINKNKKQNESFKRNSYNYIINEMIIKELKKLRK